MKIAGLETFLVAPRWLFLRIASDEGVTGWGEPVIEGRAETVRAAVHELADYLVGRDPLRIEDHWQALTKGGFYRGGPILSSAVARIDQDLWDIAGKTYGVPVHRLLGGPVRDRVRMYAWIGGDRPSEVAELAEEQMKAGFTAVKMNGSAELAPIDTPARTAEVVARVAAVREVLGDKRDIAVDFHGRASTAMSRRLLPQLEPLHPLFVEEPVAPEHEEVGRHVAALGQLDALTERDDVVLGTSGRGREDVGNAVHHDLACRESLAGERVAGTVVVTAARGGGVDAVVVVEAVERDRNRSARQPTRRSAVRLPEQLGRGSRRRMKQRPRQQLPPSHRGHDVLDTYSWRLLVIGCLDDLRGTEECQIGAHAYELHQRSDG
ncbi:galactonate dehydratase [Streptomyces sp. NPDC048420]|uniref:galactonate dehydratase n=1 Tax=Streptomyces sp. NPDC048420 TaxID=3155755 RepID=UPI0034332F2A